MGKRPAPDPDNCLGGSFPPLVNCAVGAHYEISFVLLLGERSRFSRILKKLLISSARCLSQAECRPEITRLASNIRSGEPFADHHVPGWITLMDSAPIGQNFISECAKFLFSLPLRTLNSGLIGFEVPSARSCNSDSANHHCTGLPV